jgi:hypothetical protein
MVDPQVLKLPADLPALLSWSRCWAAELSSDLAYHRVGWCGIIFSISCEWA